MTKSLIFLGLFGFCFSLAAQEIDIKDRELPEPLSFKDALLFADKEYHHSFLLAQSAIAAVKANSAVYDSTNDLQINLKGYLRKVGVSEFGNESEDNDSKISLIVKKNVYDFGLSSNQDKLADLLLKVKLIEFEWQKEQYLNQVVKAYFNVLKSDNDYLSHNENMAIAFIRFNRARENMEFGLSSDLDILKVQSQYEKVRQQRFISEAQQRYSRQALAELLGSTSIPDQLETPIINTQRQLLDDVDLLVDLAIKNSKEMKLQQAKLNAAKQSVKVASFKQSATIDAEFELSDYQRNSAFRDEWRASLNFNFPLYSGRKNESSIMFAQAQLNSEFSALLKLQSTQRLQVLELWQRIKQKTLELEGAKIKQEYRDFYLEQSRADYELEYKSDLGDAMVQYSRSRAERYRVEFDLESAWRELTTLVGLNNTMKIQKQIEIR